VVTVEAVVVAEDSAAVIVEAAAEVDSAAAVVVAVVVQCVEEAEAETETALTKHPPHYEHASRRKLNKTNDIQEATPITRKNFYKVATPPQTIFKKKPSPTFSTPCFFLPL